MKKLILSITAISVILGSTIPIQHSEASSLQQVRQAWMKKMQQNTTIKKQSVKETIARVYVDNEFVGSGVWLENGKILTANHILADSHEGSVLSITYGGVNMEAKLDKADKLKDLALLSTNLSSHTYTTVASTSAVGQTGRSLSADGININSGILLDKGIPIEIDDIYGVEISTIPRDIYSFKASIGESGSAIFSEDGKIIGIVSAKITTTSSKYEVGSCISVSLEDITSFLKR